MTQGIDIHDSGGHGIGIFPVDAGELLPSNLSTPLEVTG